MNDYRLARFKDSIFICGFMGTGKSTLGLELAKSLQFPFIDLDHYIEEKERSSIAEIFTEKGEPYFRALEWKYLLELTKDFKGVVSLGGGALQNQRVIDHLKLHGILVFIETPMDVILERVMRNKKRPIVLDKDGKLKSQETLFTDLKTLYSSREGLYKQAQVKFVTDKNSAKDEQVRKLIEKIKRHV